MAGPRQRFRPLPERGFAPPAPSFHPHTSTKSPKIISSFANTHGGFWIIGADTDKATNLPKFPLAGVPRSVAGVQEQITQSALTGIYPPLFPGVQPVAIPGNPDHLVYVVRVLESIEAPHAIDDGTRLYIRVASTTQPYKLAHVDQIEYLLKRRQEPERRREDILGQMELRSTFHNQPRKFRFIIGALYPRGVVIPMDALVERATNLRERGVRLLGDFRTIHQGVFSKAAVPGKRLWHFEANTAGLMFFEEPINDWPQVQDLKDGAAIPFTNVRRLIRSGADVLNAAVGLLNGYVTNLLVRYELFRWQGVAFVPEKLPDVSNPGGEIRQYVCTDDHVSVSDTAVLETLVEDRTQVLTQVLRQVLFAFNWYERDLTPFVADATR